MKLRHLLLAIALMLAPLSLSEAFAKVYIVAVGISDYPGTVNDLRLCAKDARDMVATYKRNAGQNNIVAKTLTDSQATVGNIVNAMNDVFSRAGRNDIVVFFYSGHGYPGGFNAYDGELTYARVRQAMSRSRSNNKMIFADACYAGGLSSPSRQSQNSAVSSAKRANVMLFLASRSDETSFEMRNAQNGLFTTHLLKGIRGGADKNRDRTITARELYNYVHPAVIQESDQRQHPVMWGNFPNAMPVLKW